MAAYRRKRRMSSLEALDTTDASLATHSANSASSSRATVGTSGHRHRAPPPHARTHTMSPHHHHHTRTRPPRTHEPRRCTHTGDTGRPMRSQAARTGPCQGVGMRAHGTYKAHQEGARVARGTSSTRGAHAQKKHRPYSHTHMHTHADMYTCTHAHMHIHMHTCTHAHMHTCTHAHMHTCTHAHMHTRTNAHVHTYIQPTPTNTSMQTEQLREGARCTVHARRGGGRGVKGKGEGVGVQKPGGGTHPLAVPAPMSTRP